MALNPKITDNWHVVHTDYDGKPLCIWIKRPGYTVKTHLDSWFESPCGMYRLRYNYVDGPYLGQIPGMFLRPFGKRKADWDSKKMVVHDPTRT